ncbi:hypothetical protein N7474_007697 [Penicillium riverlandense]|uniref:uncharacterized protein n=1 Tax=Penicillium riverlandense TaxID=1903569 RepID=UPI0025475C93|nr:uncharacterized protein N7474_007697 [Penicillium riverlandense]KAJ5811396.1 hypothetical protein N7474_007697 [Penicillium riverlandense]
MPSEGTKRQPLSCENCRQRKIRCIGYGVPCDTCRKRGFALSCHFKRDIEPATRDTRNHDAQQVLLQRISTLENLLQQNIDLTAVSINSQQLHTLRSPVSDHNLPSSAGHIAASPLSMSTSNQTPPPRQKFGTLATSPTGHVRYIPYNTSPDSDLLDSLQDSIQPHPPTPEGFPFFSDMPTVHRSLLDMLPPSRQCDELVSIFLEVFSPLFHILHDPTFQSAYVSFKNDPHSSPLAFLGLLFTSLGLAVTALDENNSLLEDLGRESSPAANIRSLAAKYRSAAMKCLAADNFMWRHNLHTVQCLVLLVYAINHTHGPAWSLLGTTLNIAIAIGCHIDPAALNVDLIQAEERRRVWAALMMLYTIQNTCLGNLTPFKLEHNVPLPADLDDEEILSSHSPPKLYPSGTRKPTKMSYILFKFRLYHLASDICQLTSSVSPTQSQIHALDDRINAEQNEQAARFQGKTDLPTYHQAHSFILDNYTNHLILLLHRPSFSLEDWDGSIDASYERCKQAALVILSNYQMLHTRQEFHPYCWYINGVGSFHAFLAVSTLLVLVGKEKAMTESRHFMSEAVQGCLARFQEKAPYSEICRNAFSILKPLIVGENHQTASLPALTPNVPEFEVMNTTGGSTDQSVSMDIRDDGFEGLDLNGWTVPESLEHMLCAIPSEQWLYSAGFPWAQPTSI